MQNRVARLHIYDTYLLHIYYIIITFTTYYYITVRPFGLDQSYLKYNFITMFFEVLLKDDYIFKFLDVIFLQ